MLLASLLVGAFTVAPATQTAADVPCHECPQAVWYVDETSPVNGPGDSWATAFRRLPPAISAAAPGDCIWVAAGTYTPTGSLDRTKTIKVQKALRLFGGFAGNELCLAARAGDFWNTVLSGDIGQPGVKADNSHTVLTVTGPVPTGEMLDVLVDGFRITGGFSDSTLPGSSNGGGISAFTGALRLQNCFVRRNEARSGGGLYCQGVNLSIRDTGFGQNRARDGAGIHCAGGAVRVFNASLRKNRAIRNGGGAYLVNMGATTTSIWANVLFEGNQAKRGGALYVDQGTTFPPPTPWIFPGRAHLVGCTVTRNSATLLGPGLAGIDHPILVSMAGQLDVQNSIIWNNGGPKPEIVGWDGTDVTYSIVPFTSPFASGLNLPLDPLISSPYFRPQSGSPAIDAGNLSKLFPDELDLDGDGDVLEPTPLDWLDRKRVQGAGVDMGASEY